MKYLFKTLIIFTATFFALKFILFFFDTGHTINYNIGNFKVEENLKTKENKTLEYSIAGFEKLKQEEKETIEHLIMYFGKNKK